ncbi:hypothetical protein LGM63_36305 [Burkholderia cepacia]|uniref:hypothetical protein n=1 Tax=Burkholderia cepacia complex TaxID=87882 RepID=UPI0012D86D6C|nr:MULTISPECIES: hypothetical protein [Burkholderia cepacia complex]MCA7996113.1 hypothetical protein [Burkholderia cepacia]MCA8102524.1 hypothetical protein [Burkholderia contaminans]
MTILHHPVRKYRLPAVHRAHTIVATSRCNAPGAPPAATTAAGRLTKATRTAPRLTGALSHRITAARPAAGDASRFVTEK